MAEKQVTATKRFTLKRAGVKITQLKKKNITAIPKMAVQLCILQVFCNF